MQKCHKCKTKINNITSKYNNKTFLILCMILTINAAEGKKNTNNIDTNKENKNSLTIKVNYNPAQAAEAKKFPNSY